MEDRALSSDEGQLWLMDNIQVCHIRDGRKQIITGRVTPMYRARAINFRDRKWGRCIFGRGNSRGPDDCLGLPPSLAGFWRIGSCMVFSSNMCIETMFTVVVISVYPLLPLKSKYLRYRKILLNSTFPKSDVRVVAAEDSNLFF